MSESVKEGRDALRKLLRQVKTLTESHGVMKANFLDALWEAYFATRKPNDLANYIEAGGEIDSKTRQAVLRSLRGEDKPPHASSDVMDDIEFYTRVKGEQTRARIAEALEETEAKNTRRYKTKIRKKQPSLEDIFGEIAPNYGLTPRGAKDKYDRGRIAADERLGIGRS
jgi:hypothetical protein